MVLALYAMHICRWPRGMVLMCGLSPLFWKRSTRDTAYCDWRDALLGDDVGALSCGGACDTAGVSLGLGTGVSCRALITF